MVSRPVRIFAALLLFTLLIPIAGCTAVHPMWVDTGATYSSADVDAVIAKADASALEGRSVSELEDLRHGALVDLRSQNDTAAEAANRITNTLPIDSGVPIYVELATYDEHPDALVVVEATGSEGETFTRLRLWVIDAEGTVLFSSIRQTDAL